MSIAGLHRLSYLIEMSKRARSPSMKTRKSTSKKPKEATIAMAVDKQIVKKAEKKWIDRTFSNFLNSSTSGGNKDLDPATVLCLNSCARGTNIGERIGKQIAITSVEVHGLVRFLGRESSVGSNQGSPPSGKSVWVNLVLDRQNDIRTTAIDTTEIYVNNIATTLGSAILIRNPDFMGQFKVLKSWRYDLQQRPFLKEVVATTAGGIEADFYTWGEQVVEFHMYHKFKKPLRVRYSGNTGNIGDIVDNALHVTGGYGVETETDSPPSISYQSRVRYIDV